MQTFYAWQHNLKSKGERRRDMTWLWTESQVKNTIRREARKQNLTATSRKGLWYVADYNNYLQSPETGMDNKEALIFLWDD